MRGAGGGYRLARPADTISVGDILRALEGSLRPVSCPAYEEGEGCEGAGCCVTKFVWKKINDAISQTVDGMMLDELVRESRELLRKNREAPAHVCQN